MSTPSDIPPPILRPRPYPLRDPSEAPFVGVKALVVDGDLDRARNLAGRVATLGCGTRSLTGKGLAESLTEEVWHVVLLCTEGVQAEDLRCLATPGGPSLLACGAPGSVPGLPPAAVFAYLPADPDEQTLRHGIGRALEQAQLAQENLHLRAKLEGRHSFGGLVTRDPAMSAALDVSRSVADTQANVLLTGESGTGKTLLAQVIHEHSARREGPFVTVNCGSLPSNLLESELFGHTRGAFSGAHRDRPGRIVAACGGTLFLDEINSASLDMQVKLLRVIQERTLTPVGSDQEVPIDVRLITASNRPLDEEIREGRFREDLYYRIHVVSVEIPPLRARPGDLLPLCERFVTRFAEAYDKPVAGLTPDCLALLAGHEWPGNVRQLENALERAVLMSQGVQLRPEDLGSEILEAVGWRPEGPAADSLSAGLAHLEQLPPLREALEGPERAIITRALELCGGNRKGVAAMLDINRSTLFNKMRKYGLMDRCFE